MHLSFVIFAAAIFILPIITGLIGTWLPAVGYLPSIGRQDLTIAPFIDLFNHPSTFSSIKTTVSSGVLATLLAFLISQWLCMRLYNTPGWRWLKKSIAPLLAVPHLAFAIGFAFIIAPSGWFMRWLSPTLTGFNLPPDWLIINDQYAITLTLALVIKEIPFFLLMSLSAINHLNVDKILHLAASFKYSHVQAWIKLIFPQMFAQLRLPLYAVLSYALSVVDISIVLGPTAPSTFAVLVNQWFNDANVEYRLMAASGASVLLILVMVLVGLFYAVEQVIKKVSKGWLIAGPSDALAKRFVFSFPAYGVLSLVAMSVFLSVTALWVWSITKQWRFPDAFPSQWSFKYWQKSGETLVEALYNSTVIGLSSSAIALVICILVLQWQSRQTQQNSCYVGVLNIRSWMLAIIYLPILIPQVSFLFGIQVLLVKLNLEGAISSLIWAHLIFVLPYCYLSLAKSYLQFDDRYLQVAVSLSQSTWRALFFVKLAMLFRPIAFSFAIGFAVSASQYLPSLYVGAGRINTITLESVALASGSNLKITAVFALWQFLLPLIVYLLAMGAVQYVFRNRRSMRE